MSTPEDQSINDISVINQRIEVFQTLTRLSASNASSERIYDVLAKDAGFRTNAQATITFTYNKNIDEFYPVGSFGILKKDFNRLVIDQDSQFHRSINLETIVSLPELSKSKDPCLSYLHEKGFVSAHIAPFILKEEKFGVIILLFKNPTLLSLEKMQLFQDQVQGGAIALAGAKNRDAITKYTSELESLVTERTSALAIQTARADEANHAKSQFVANMSHELRTPLTAIVGYSSVLIEGLLGELNTDQVDAIQSIYKATEHLKDLINDVLDMARVESGKEEAHQKDILLSDIIPQIMKLMTQTAAGKNIQLTFLDSEKIDDLKIFADGRHIRQIMINLISNGIKYTPAGGKVSISVQTEGDKALICVSDNGVGIPVSDHNKVFQEYSRLEDEYSKAQVGTGLGLNLTKRLVELNGGRIHFESQVGVGTKFIFSCPLVVKISDDQEKSAKEYTNLNAKVLPKLDGLKILILEDDCHNLNLMKSLLEKLGAETVTSGTVQDAMDHSSDIDVALVDIALKGESGNDYLISMKRDYSDIPLIVVSACVFERDINQAKERGADAFLAKPFDPHELISLIRKTTIERVLVN